MPETTRVEMSKIPDIEYLRAIAVSFTLLAHIRFLYFELPTWQLVLFKRLEFWGGVDLFFVISGFVIFKNLLPQWRALSMTAAERVHFVVRFWLRRVRRLLPAAWFWAFVSLAVTAISQPALFKTNVYEVVAALLQVYNLQVYVCSTGAATCSHEAVGVYWSLSLEEQIYAVLPVVMAFLKRHIALVVLVMLAADLVLQVNAPLLRGVMRFDGFCWGMLVAILYDRADIHAFVDEFFLKPLGQFKLLGASLMLVAIPAIGAGAIVHTMSYSLVAGCGAVLVFLASYGRNYLGLPRALHPLMAYLGSRSYSIYLVHPPVFHALRWISRGHGQEQGWGSLMLWPALAIVIVFALSDLSFRFIEQRWRLQSAAAPPLNVMPQRLQSA